MTDYDPPLADMRRALDVAAGLAEIACLPGCAAGDPETVAAVLEEAARLAREVVAPLNRVGDKEPARLENGVVRTPPGYAAAYRAYVEGGWNSLPFEEEAGGQGLPAAVALAVTEMWNAASLAFALCPLLTVGAVEALQRHGTEEQQRLYLPKLVAGEWTGTMNLTEPQAGSDVGALRCRAVPEGDHWRITGQKIFITFGDHDMAENIIHLVLARTPGAPAGTRGISLFLVPKYLVGPDGATGARNDVRVVSLEHKLGIHGSPTAVMSYGDEGGAWGTMIGSEHRGMECMFTMMNAARLNVGVQGIAVAERAYQQARAYALTRIQGRPPGSEAEPRPIAWHPDVQRMLLTMKATTEAARALAYYAAGQIDRARHAPEPAARAAAQARADLLIPLVKGWATDLGVETASLALQVHGGMGFIEETGIAQLYRDARILPIYEGTNGIQALDLIGRKLMRDKGAEAYALLDEMRALDGVLAGSDDADLQAIRRGLARALDALGRATGLVLAQQAAEPATAAAGATAYLTLFASCVGGWLLARQALAAVEDGDRAKPLTARFFAEHILPRAEGLLPAIEHGSTVLRFDPAA